MKIYLDWLKDYVDPALSTEEVGRLLTFGGLEVEAQEQVALSDGRKADVLELNVTPNRGYALSHMGVARELAALAGTPCKIESPMQSLEEVWGPEAIDACLKVTNNEPELCTRYSALAIDGVEVKPSPQWLADRLTAIGLRPINNIVDITNYVLMEYGQPLHAFDADLLAGSEIIVRRARAGEAFTALDGTEVKLGDDALVIADADKAAALAGIMGGQGSEVTQKTRNVILESACFHAPTVRKGSKKYGIRSDSSMRFEREVDYEGVVQAQARAALLIRELAGGTIRKGRIDLVSRPSGARLVTLRPQRVRQILGTEISVDEISDCLRRLGFGVEESGESFEVEIPSFRPIIEREIELIEEIARLRGYRNIEPEAPRGAIQAVALTPQQQATRQARNALSQAGYNEAVNFSFSAEKQARYFMSAFAPKTAQSIALNNPLSEELGVMRVSLIPGLLNVAKGNISRGQKPVRIFEQGALFYREDGGKRIETASLAALAVGPYEPNVWKESGAACDFYDVKGALETAISDLRMTCELRPADRDFLAPGAADCLINGVVVGYIGALSDAIQRAWELPHVAYAFELDFNAVTEQLPGRPQFHSIPKFPEVYRDISVLVDRSVKAGALTEQIRAAGGPLLRRIDLYDHFEGKKIEKGKKSLTYSLSFQSPDRTLSDEEINPVFDKIVNTLSEKLGATLRE